ELFRHGLKLYWSDWRSHPNPMTTLSFHSLLEPMRRAGELRRFALFGVTPLPDSRAQEIHPLASPGDSAAWDPALHPDKPLVTFAFPVFREIAALVATRDDSWPPEALAALRAPVLLYDSD